MINRALIRIKVVQMLFCYFLNRNEFKLHPAPMSASRDKQYAYNLYLDLLLMALRLSGYRIGQSGLTFSNKFLSENRIGKALKSDSTVKDVVYKRSTEATYYDAALEKIYTAIIGSAAYRSYTHKKGLTISDDVMLWNVIINDIMAKSSELLDAARRDETFTNVGFENAFKMFDETVRSCGDSSKLLIESRSSLRNSLGKAYELYNRLLLLPVALVELQERRIDAAKCKYLATAEDLNPNMRFVDNRLVKFLSDNELLCDYKDEKKINWNDDPDFLMAILDEIQASDLYNQYMNSDTESMEEDCEFWRQIMKQIILTSDRLAELLESKSVYWNDDVDIIGTFVCKTFRRVAKVEKHPILPQFKDEEDEQFGERLFMDTIKNFDQYRSYIDMFINARQWDPERLAFMDVIIMSTAISELINFPAIPIPVTLNEYIEIANAYSTPRSGQFINGILYSVITYLQENGILLKK